MMAIALRSLAAKPAGGLAANRSAAASQSMKLVVLSRILNRGFSVSSCDRESKMRGLDRKLPVKRLSFIDGDVSVQIDQRIEYCHEFRVIVRPV